MELSLSLSLLGTFAPWSESSILGNFAPAGKVLVMYNFVRNVRDVDPQPVVASQESDSQGKN